MSDDSSDAAALCVQIDTTSVSGGTSVNEESLDSLNNERCVTDGKKHFFRISKCEKESDDDSGNKLTQIQSSNCAEKLSSVFAKRVKKEPQDTPEKNKPIFSVTFRNQDTARRYKRAIRKFLKELITNHDPEVEECDTSDLEMDIWEETSKNEPENSCDDANLFMFDTRPTLKAELDVPAYNPKSDKVLRNEEEENENGIKKGRASAPNTCFNCGGNHSLRDCTQPKDHALIAKNRRQFSSRFGSNQGKARFRLDSQPSSADGCTRDLGPIGHHHLIDRYHLDEEQKYAGFVPGQLSSKLREALGVPNHHLPKHIYRMRLLGYPPGWMEEAKISHSGLTLYDSQGKVVADPEEEEGEIVPEGAKDKYDTRKIISYPGFNVPCSPGTLDEYEYHNCPPMSSEQSKEYMLAQLSQNAMKAYKRKKLANNALGTPNRPTDQDLTEADMEVEDIPNPENINLLDPNDNCKFIPPLPKDTPPRPPPPPSTESESEGGDAGSQGSQVASPSSTGQSAMSSPRAQSPSLSDLETRKQLLLAELEDGCSSSDTLRGVAPQTTPTPNTPGPSSLGKVKSVDLGTPIIQSVSPYSKLPTADKWQQDICDVINFENLPDATGKYERMSELLRKVRTTVARIQQDDDDDYDSGGK